MFALSLVLLVAIPITNYGQQTEDECYDVCMTNTDGCNQMGCLVDNTRNTRTTIDNYCRSCAKQCYIEKEVTFIGKGCDEGIACIQGCGDCGDLCGACGVGVDTVFMDYKDSDCAAGCGVEAYCIDVDCLRCFPPTMRPTGNPTKTDGTPTSSPTRSNVAQTSNPTRSNVAQTSNPTRSTVAQTSNPTKSNVAQTSNPTRSVGQTSNPTRSNVVQTSNPTRSNVAQTSNPTRSNVAQTNSPTRSDGGGRTNSPTRSDGGQTNSPTRADGGETGNPTRSDSTQTNSPTRSDGGQTNSPTRSDGGQTNSPSRSDGGETRNPTRKEQTNSPTRSDGGQTNSPTRSDSTQTNSPTRKGQTNSPTRSDGGETSSPTRSDGGETNSPTRSKDPTSSPTREGQTRNPTRNPTPRRYIFADCIRDASISLRECDERDEVPEQQYYILIQIEFDTCATTWAKEARSAFFDLTRTCSMQVLTAKNYDGDTARFTDGNQNNNIYTVKSYRCCDDDTSADTISDDPYGDRRRLNSDSVESYDGRDRDRRRLKRDSMESYHSFDSEERRRLVERYSDGDYSDVIDEDCDGFYTWDTYIAFYVESEAEANQLYDWFLDNRDAIALYLDRCQLGQSKVLDDADGRGFGKVSKVRVRRIGMMTPDGIDKRVYESPTEEPTESPTTTTFQGPPDNNANTFGLVMAAHVMSIGMLVFGFM